MSNVLINHNVYQIESPINPKGSLGQQRLAFEKTFRSSHGPFSRTDLVKYYRVLAAELHEKLLACTLDEEGTNHALYLRAQISFLRDQVKLFGNDSETTSLIR